MNNTLEEKAREIDEAIIRNDKLGLGVKQVRWSVIMNVLVQFHESQSKWISVSDRLPEPLQTVWLSNGKGFTCLGCRVETNDGWHWAESNGIIYEDKGKIVSECESDDLDVSFWVALPSPPKEET